MSVITFDPAAFRLAFTRWANISCPTDATLTAWFNIACLYFDPNNACGCSFVGLTDAMRAETLNLVTAHVGYIFDATNKGEPVGIITQATIDKISVTAKAPPVQNNSMFQYWLAQSPYGQMVLALLGQLAAGGMYIGGAPERAAFRHVGGGFGPLWPGRC